MPTGWWHAPHSKTWNVRRRIASRMCGWRSALTLVATNTRTGAPHRHTTSRTAVIDISAPPCGPARRASGQLPVDPLAGPGGVARRADVERLAHHRRGAARRAGIPGQAVAEDDPGVAAGALDAGLEVGRAEGIDRALLGQALDGRERLQHVEQREQAVGA